MGLNPTVLQLMLVGQILAKSNAPLAAAEAMQGCHEKCGNLSIPYPFGTKEGCYLNDDFFINCNESFPNTAPTPYLRESNIEVTNITSEGQIHDLQYIAKDYYSKKGSGTYSNRLYIRLSNFYVSYTKNKFDGIGCDTSAIVQGTDGNWEEYTSGCVSICNSTDNVLDQPNTQKEITT